MDSPARRITLWRDGSSRRVAHGTLAGAAVGAVYATVHALPVASVLRASVLCGAVTAPFFALREAVSAGAGVDGPVASAIAGGFAGYFGALVRSGPQWKAVSHGAMVVGVGCGLLDVFVSGLDWRRKVMLVNRHDEAMVAASQAVEKKQSNGDTVLSAGNSQRGWFKWPVWFPVLKDIDEEYQDLLRRQEATVLALEEEQARIAALLEALESLKASKQVRDAEMAECESDGTDRSSNGSVATSSTKSGP